MSKKPPIIVEGAVLALFGIVVLFAVLSYWPSPHTVHDEWSSLGTVTARFSQPFVVAHMILASGSIAVAVVFLICAGVAAMSGRRRSIFSRAAMVLGALMVLFLSAGILYHTANVWRAEATLTSKELRIVGSSTASGWIPDRRETVYIFEQIDAVTLTTINGKASSIRFEFKDGQREFESVEGNFAEIWPMLERVGFLSEADAKKQEEQERQATFERWQQNAAEERAQEREMKARELEAHFERFERSREKAVTPPH